MTKSRVFISYSNQDRGEVEVGEAASEIVGPEMGFVAAPKSHVFAADEPLSPVFLGC
jgi:hypothetical protein